MKISKQNLHFSTTPPNIKVENFFPGMKPFQRVGSYYTAENFVSLRIRNSSKLCIERVLKAFADYLHVADEAARLGAMLKTALEKL